jgi:hypothetical protein
MNSLRRMQRPQDAAQVWSELRSATEKHFDAYADASTGQRALAQQRLLLALEMRWKLEEQILIPALQDGEAASPQEALLGADEITQLRDMAQALKDGSLEDSATTVVLGVLEGMATLRSVRIERALAAAKRSRRIDSHALAREMQGMLSRWRGELRATGDIEDEEADPVGRPPR